MSTNSQQGSGPTAQPQQQQGQTEQAPQHQQQADGATPMTPPRRLVIKDWAAI